MYSLIIGMIIFQLSLIHQQIGGRVAEDESQGWKEINVQYVIKDKAIQSNI